MSLQYGLVSANQLPAFAPLIPEELRAGAPGLYALGAVMDGQAVGVLLFRADDSIIELLYLSVAEAHRRQGIANGMIDFLCEYAWKHCVALTGSFSTDEANGPFCSLLCKRGDFTLTETEDYICRFPCAALEQITLSAVPPSGSRIAAFYSLAEAAQRAFFTHMKEEDGEFAAMAQAERAQMLEPLCLCTVDDHGAVTAAIFCRKDEDSIVLSLAYALPGHARSLMALTGRLRELLIKAADRVTYLKIAAVTPESRKLVETLLPEREITAQFYTLCWDMNTMGG